MDRLERIETALHQLLQLPFYKAGAAGSLLWISFGDEIVIPDDRTGGTRTVGTWALHVECPWRITCASGIFTGSGDLWEPPILGPDGRDETFDANKDKTRFDKQIKEFNARVRGVSVSKLEADLAGGFKLYFSRSHILEVMPVASQDIHAWRLFRPGLKSKHFVVTGNHTYGPAEIKIDNPSEPTHET